MLGEHLEDETQEHFGLTWPGKREARRLAALPPQGTLIPAPGEGVDEETAPHIFIETDNLEALKRQTRLRQEDHTAGNRRQLPAGD